MLKNRLRTAAMATVVGGLCAAAPAQTVSLQAGLQTYYSMDDISGTSVPDTAGPTADNGVLTRPASPAVAAGKFGSGLSLTSPSSTAGTYVGLPSSNTGDLASITNAVSVSLWANVSSSNTGANNSFYDSSADGFVLFGTAAGISFKVTNGVTTSQNVRATSTGVNVFNTATNTPGFVHIVGTYDGATTAIWINGTKFAGQSAAYPSLRTQVANLGADTAANTLMTGVLDDVGVWNRALTDAEIAYLYNGGVGNPIPVPEPAGAALFAASAVPLAARRRRGTGGRTADR
jgi:hypothetical protein